MGWGVLLSLPATLPCGLNSTGRKVRSLPAAQAESSSNETEQKLAEIWQSVLGIEQIGVHDNFFDLGGDSLLITRVHAQFVEAFEREMYVATLMQYPTIADLAQQMVQANQKTEAPTFEDIRERSNKQKLLSRQKS